LMGVAVSNIVMFGLILAVGILVDGAIVVVEYADKRIADGEGPMHAYVAAAKRMFWPVVSSTATTLCAFLPMLFWPGVPGEFMGMLPVTLIFVLSASLLVALVYLPVMGGVTGRLERWFTTRIDQIASVFWLWHILLFPLAGGALALAGAGAPSLLETVADRFAAMDGARIVGSVIPTLATVFGLLLGVVALAAGAITGVVAILLGLMAIGRRFGNAFRLLGRTVLPRRRDKVAAGHRRSPFGWAIQAITGNPVAPLLAFCIIFVLVGSVLIYYMNNNNGTEFFVESEPENAIVYVRARGNLSIDQKDALVEQVEDIVLEHPNVRNAFAFAGDGGLNNNTGGAQPPLDTIGQVQLEMIPWEDRPTTTETWFTLPFVDYDVTRDITAPRNDGDRTIDELTAELAEIPGIKTEILALERGPASAKPVHLRIKGDDWEKLLSFTRDVREKFDETRGLKLIEDTLPVPGIDWQIDVDVQKAGRFGADVATVGAMVQLVTRGILLDTMRVPSSDEEIEIRVRLPERDRVLSTLDTLKIRTAQGLVPLSNFISREPVRKLAQIDRVDQTRYFDVKAGVIEGLTTGGTGDGAVPLTANERIAHLTEWLESGIVPSGLDYEWTGDQEDQEESGAFLQKAFAGALALMFIILLAQFNSIYNAVLVLLAVVLSTTGVLIGMLVMNQPFSIIMTGTGIVALAGIVVNNNIVLIDTYQEFSRYMPRIEAIIRTAEARIRPVLLTTITTMAGLAPMMFGLSLDFIAGGYSFNSPTALWWKQLATAVVFGLGIATILTLVFTPSMLALRVWATTYVEWAARLMAMVSMGRGSRAARDWALNRAARHTRAPELIWEDERTRDTGYVDDTGDGPELADLKRVLRSRDTGAPDSGDDDAAPTDGNPLRAAE
ncbi:MAG: efflux RND transporter permease subunit, partial [Roseovarius sp.]|nr:efflux RND transporter permease subunit [Roseovarius sp.]